MTSLHKKITFQTDPLPNVPWMARPYYPHLSGMDRGTNPVRKPCHLWRGCKKKMFIHYLPRRVTYGLILVFARPLVFRSAAKARNPYTHGVKGGIKTPSFLTGFVPLSIPLKWG